jgi:electron transfer flavoprotein beta subunit
MGNPRLGTVRSKLQSRKAEIPVWGPDEIGAKEAWLGLKGSPTRVVKVYSPKLARKGEVIVVKTPEDLENAAQSFVQFLKNRELTDFISRRNGGG